MLFNIGDLVTRNSYNNDIVFKIIDIKDNFVVLKGINVRLVADAEVDDLVMCDGCEKEYIDNDEDILRKMDVFRNLNRDDFFYLPGKILHIDAVYFDN